MPLTLNQVTANTATVTLTGGVIGDNTLTVEYRPTMLTEKLIAQMQAFSAPGLSKDADRVVASLGALNEILAGKPSDPPEPGLIKAWDFYEDDAQTQMVPITARRLADIPIALRMQIVTAILKDMRPEALAA